MSKTRLLMLEVTSHCKLPVREPELSPVGAPAPVANPSVYSFPILS
jgi:hypothetical protein